MSKIAVLRIRDILSKTIRIDRDHRRSSQRSRVTVISTWAVKRGQVGGDSGRINGARTNYATESHDLTQISRRLLSRLAADTRHTHTRKCACEVEMWNRLQEALHRVLSALVSVFEYTNTHFRYEKREKQCKENLGDIKIRLYV